MKRLIAALFMWREMRMAANDLANVPATSGGGGLTIDSTAITGGTATRVLFESSTNKVSESAKLTFDSTGGLLTVGVAGTSAGGLVIGTAASVNQFISIDGATNSRMYGRNNGVGITWSLLTDTAATGSGHATFNLGALGNFGFTSANAVGTLDVNASRISAGVLGIGTGAQGSAAGSLAALNVQLTGVLGVRALTTLTDGADGTNTNNYKFVSFVSNSAEAGNVIRISQTAAVTFTATSDERMKNIIGDSDAEAARARVMAYSMKQYEWKSQPGLLFDGPIAQQTYAVNKHPTLVTPGDDKESWKINMSGFVPDLIMAVQQQQKQIEELKKELGLLKAKTE